jgi:hypothetical protein
MISRLNAGMSSGLRLVINWPSTTTPWLNHQAANAELVQRFPSVRFLTPGVVTPTSSRLYGDHHFIPPHEP